MSEQPPSSPSPTPYSGVPISIPAPRSGLVELGGGLGIAACVLGLLIFLAACAGFEMALAFALLPMGFGLVGLAVTIIGAAGPRKTLAEDTGVLAALFVNILGIVGALVEIAAWRGWALFAPAGGGM